MKIHRYKIIILTIIVLLAVLYIGTKWNQKNKMKDAATNIVLIEVDNDTLNKLGRWPLPRSVFGSLIQKLSQNGAAAIVIDVLFTENSTKEDDDALRNGIKKSKNVILPILNSEPIFLDKSGAKYGAIAFYPDKNGIIKDMPTYGKNLKIPTIASIVAGKFLCKSECRFRNTTISLHKPPAKFEKMSFYRIFEMADVELRTKIDSKIVIVGVSSPDNFSKKKTIWSDNASAIELLGLGISTMLVEKHMLLEKCAQ